MPILLSDFIETPQGKAGCVELIKKMHYFKPVAQDTVESEYYSKKYPDLDERGLQLLTHKQFILEFFLDKNIGRWAINRKNLFLSPQLAAQIAIPLKAALFDITNIGNCGGRASYAAFKLHEILEGSGLKVTVKSAKFADHVVVYIGKLPDLRVYDPLTNPELIFGFEEYQKKIMPLFKPRQVLEKLQIEVKITPALRNQYPTIKNEFCDLFVEEMHDPEKLQAFKEGIVGKVPNFHLFTLDILCDEFKKGFKKMQQKQAPVAEAKGP